MKTKLHITLLFTFLLAGCSTHFALFNTPTKPTTATVTVTPANTLAVATTLGAADVQTERVTKKAVDSIASASAKLRSVAKDSPFYGVISPLLDTIDRSVLDVNTELAFHPAAVVQHTLVLQATKLAHYEAPDSWWVAFGYSVAAALVALGGVATFARGWLLSVPVVGAYLSNIIGARVGKSLPLIGAGVFILTRFYIWCSYHPKTVTLFEVLIGITLGMMYANAVDAGWHTKLASWLKSKLPWLRTETEKIEADAISAEAKTAAFIKAEVAAAEERWTRLVHGVPAAAPQPPIKTNP